MVNKKNKANITIEFITKIRVICIRPMMLQEKKAEKERRKYQEPKNYEVFKKKEAARVREYSFKKMMLINYRLTLERQPQKLHQTRLQNFLQNKFCTEVFKRLKDNSHPVRNRRPR